MTEMDIHEIFEALPHRYPFLFVDMGAPDCDFYIDWTLYNEKNDAKRGRSKRYDVWFGEK